MTVHLRLLDAIGMYCAIRSLSHLNPRGLGEQSLHPVVVIGPQKVRADRSTRNCSRIKLQKIIYLKTANMLIHKVLMGTQCGNPTWGPNVRTQRGDSGCVDPMCLDSMCFDPMCFVFT